MANCKFNHADAECRYAIHAWFIWYRKGQRPQPCDWQYAAVDAACRKILDHSTSVYDIYYSAGYCFLGYYTEVF